MLGRSNSLKITIIGAGYVGLVTGACLSEVGHEVMCVEKLPSKLEILCRGMSPIYEPGLNELLQKNINENRLFFTDKIEEGIKFSDVIFLCVGTPQGEDGKADLSQVEEAVRQIAENMDSYKLIVEKSTVPVNTHKKIEKTVKRYLRNKNIDFDVASNPEFLREGSAVYDFMNPDRIVVGVNSDRAKEIMEEIYKPFTDRGFPLIITKTTTAELIKYASNSFLAMKISYINMVADLCEKVGADIKEVAEGMGYDKRIGKQFLNAGIGYGGSCFPKDVKAFIKIAEEYGLNFSLLKDTDEINKNRRKQFIRKIEEAIWIVKNKNVAIWGLAFKPNTDDIREAPSIDIVNSLLNMGANLKLYDPQAREHFQALFPEQDRLKYAYDKYEAVKYADVLVILTEWDEFKEADLDKVKSLMHTPIIVDGRNIFDLKEMEEKGFEYYSIGREPLV